MTVATTLEAQRGAARAGAAARAAGLLLPVVVLSVPFMDFPGIGGGAYVKPLALPTVLLAFVFVVARAGLRLAPLDRFDKLWLALFAWAVAGDFALPWLIAMPHEMKGQSLGGRIVRDLVSLSAGMMVWAWLRLAIDRPSQAVTAVRWALRAFALVLPFLVVQAAVVITDAPLAHAADTVLALLRSPTQLPIYRKIFGTAPEASMLADQLLTLWLPFALAALLLGTSLFRARPLGLRIEAWILLLGILALVLSQSRIGLIAVAFLLVTGWLLALRASGSRLNIKVLVLPVALAIGVGGAIVGGGSTVAGYIESFGGLDASIDNSVWSNVTRMATMIAGLDMVAHHPLGVGTGAYPFMFEQSVPDWALIDPEIQGLIGGDTDYLELLTGTEGGDIESRLPDAKALPVRVLAELGLPGLVLLAAIWLGLLRGCWRRMRGTDRADPLRTVAFGALLALLTMLPLSFSINSYVWVHWILIATVAAALWVPKPPRPHGRRRGNPRRRSRRPSSPVSSLPVTT